MPPPHYCGHAFADRHFQAAITTFSAELIIMFLSGLRKVQAYKPPFINISFISHDIAPSRRYLTAGSSRDIFLTMHMILAHCSRRSHYQVFCRRHHFYCLGISCPESMPSFHTPEASWLASFLRFRCAGIAAAVPGFGRWPRARPMLFDACLSASRARRQNCFMTWAAILRRHDANTIHASRLYQ